MTNQSNQCEEVKPKRRRGRPRDMDIVPYPRPWGPLHDKVCRDYLRLVETADGAKLKAADAEWVARINDLDVGVVKAILRSELGQAALDRARRQFRLSQQETFEELADISIQMGLHRLIGMLKQWEDLDKPMQGRVLAATMKLPEYLYGKKVRAEKAHGPTLSESEADRLWARTRQMVTVTAEVVEDVRGNDDGRSAGRDVATGVHGRIASVNGGESGGGGRDTGQEGISDGGGQ